MGVSTQENLSEISPEYTSVWANTSSSGTWTRKTHLALDTTVLFLEPAADTKSVPIVDEVQKDCEMLLSKVEVYLVTTATT